MSKKRKYDGTAPDIGKLEAEKREAYQARAIVWIEIVKKKLDYIYYGITT